MGFSPQLDRVIPKCTWNNKEHRTAKTILKKKEEEEGNLPHQVSIGTMEL